GGVRGAVGGHLGGRPLPGDPTGEGTRLRRVERLARWGQGGGLGRRGCDRHLVAACQSAGGQEQHPKPAACQGATLPGRPPAFGVPAPGEPGKEGPPPPTPSAAPPRLRSGCSPPSWSQTRPTTKPTMSSTLGGRV